MATLLLRLSAPMQSWGTQSNFTHRDTRREPSKSGIVGLLCAALGIPRSVSFIEDPYKQLVDLRMGVRVDREGTVRRDFHSAGMGGIYKVKGGSPKKSLVISNRYYLADAKFLVGLEGESDLLAELQAALQRPRWFLFLGRKAYIPAERIWLADGLRSESLEKALTQYDLLDSTASMPRRLRYVFEDPAGDVTRNDHVISFAERRFIPRRVRITTLMTPQPVQEE